jgi:hypothetical protein
VEFSSNQERGRLYNYHPEPFQVVCALMRQRTGKELALFSCQRCVREASGMRPPAVGSSGPAADRRRRAPECTGRQAGCGRLQCGVRWRRRDGGGARSTGCWWGGVGDGSGWDRGRHGDLLPMTSADDVMSLGLIEVGVRLLASTNYIVQVLDAVLFPHHDP